MPSLELNNVTWVHPIQILPHLFQDIYIARTTLKHHVKLIRVWLNIAFQKGLFIHMMNINTCSPHPYNNQKHTYIK